METPNHQSPSPADRCWTSGRKLTAAQRERKRAVDRQSSSKRRIQTASRITSLESKLEQLTSELESLKRSQNQAPQCALAQSFEPDLFDVSQSAFPTISRTTEQPSVPVSDIQPCFDFHAWTDPVGSNANAAAAIAAVSFGADEGFIEASTNLRAALPIVNQETNTGFDPISSTAVVLDRNQGTDCQNIFSSVVRTARSLSQEDVCTDAQLNQDALIRGILFGWDDVMARSIFFCPLWEILRYLDKRIFRLSGIITRLCTLRMIHSMLLVRPSLCTYFRG